MNFKLDSSSYCNNIFINLLHYKNFILAKNYIPYVSYQNLWLWSGDFVFKVIFLPYNFTWWPIQDRYKNYYTIKKKIDKLKNI